MVGATEACSDLHSDWNMIRIIQLATIKWMREGEKSHRRDSMSKIQQLISSNWNDHQVGSHTIGG